MKKTSRWEKHEAGRVGPPHWALGKDGLPAEINSHRFSFRVSAGE